MNILPQKQELTKRLLSDPTQECKQFCWPYWFLPKLYSNGIFEGLVPCAFMSFKIRDNLRNEHITPN